MTSYQEREERFLRRANAMPLVVRCPLDTAPARWHESANGGLRYRCTECGVVFVVPLAQTDRPKIRRALDALPGRKP